MSIWEGCVQAWAVWLSWCQEGYSEGLVLICLYMWNEPGMNANLQVTY